MDILIKILKKYYMVFLRGLWGTIWLSVVTIIFGAILGVGIALLCMSKKKVLYGISSVYIEILRGTPVLLQLYFFWLGLPKLFPMFEMSDTFCILVALIINSSAYIAEIIRAGIGAVDSGQFEAARSLGLSEKHLMSKVILPQAIKNILPAIGNEFISIIKGTSLASTFFIVELTTSFKTVQSTTFRAIEPLLISGVIYLVLTFTLSRLLRVLERRMKASD